MTKNQEKAGLIYVFTGDGKGKTSAALGTYVRALAHGWRVGWVSWYKQASWGISEHQLEQILAPEVRSRSTFLAMGKGFYVQEADPDLSKKTGQRSVRAQSAVIQDLDSVQSHQAAAEAALQQAKKLLPTVQLLVLDEVCNAVADGLLAEEKLLDFCRLRGQTHLVLTGRSATPAIRELADLVSVIQKEKHPYDMGRLAVKGLDF